MTEDEAVLSNAELKRSRLIEKRDKLNEEAGIYRHERDVLNEKIRKLIDEIKPLKDKRNQAVEEMKHHKEKRNEYQAEAKRLIGIKKEMLQQSSNSAAREIDDLKNEISRLEKELETSPHLTVDKEKKMIEKMRSDRKKIEELRERMEKELNINASIDEIGEKITKLFELADAEHDMVQEFYENSREVHGKIEKISKEIDALRPEANRKHEEYELLKKRADGYHQRVREMTTKILEIREARKNEEEEYNKMLRDMEEDIRNKLYDEEKIEENAEKALESLKNNKKIVL